MEYILFSYIGILLVNINFFIIRKDVLENKKSFSIHHFLVPFTILDLLIRDYRERFLLSYALSITACLIFSDGLSRSLTVSNLRTNEFVIFNIFILIVLTILLYLSVHDVCFYKIPQEITEYLLIIVLVANIVLGISKLILGQLLNLNNFFAFTSLGEIENLIGLIIGIFISYLFVRFSGEKMLGLADVYIIGVLGAIFGVLGCFLAITSSLVLGSIFGVLLVTYLRKINGLIVPMIPFLTLGYVIAFSYTDLFREFLLGN